MSKNNFINDNNYTTSKINFFFNQGKSKIFIRNYFLQKGIDKDIVNKTFEDFEELNENWETESAKIFARKKRFSILDNKEKSLSKFARAGFSFEISKKILDNL